MARFRKSIYHLRHFLTLKVFGITMAKTPKNKADADSISNSPKKTTEKTTAKTAKSSKTSAAATKATAAKSSKTAEKTKKASTTKTTAVKTSAKASKTTKTASKNAEAASTKALKAEKPATKTAKTAEKTTKATSKTEKTKAASKATTKTEKATKPATKVVKKAAEQVIEKVAEKPAEKVAEKPVEKAAEKPAKKTVVSIPAGKKPLDPNEIGGDLSVLSEALQAIAYKPYMNPEQLAFFREQLNAWRKSLQASNEVVRQTLQNDTTPMADMNDRATLEEEFSLELRSRERERKLLNKIEKTLERISEDDFGYCERCGVEIGLARLEARPTAEMCIDCKELEERKEVRITDYR